MVNQLVANKDDRRIGVYCKNVRKFTRMSILQNLIKKNS